MDANEKRNQSAAPPDNWMQIFLEWKADERGVKETMAAGCLVNKSLACGFTCITVWNLHGISFNSSAHGPTTHHLHAYKADVARSCKEINTVGYGKMTHSPGGPSNKKIGANFREKRNCTVDPYRATALDCAAAYSVQWLYLQPALPHPSQPRRLPSPRCLVCVWGGTGDLFKG